MDPQQWLEAATLAFNLIGMVVCLVGLTLAQKCSAAGPAIALRSLASSLRPCPCSLSWS